MKEAIECYDKCIELEPNYTKVYDNKGNALTELRSMKRL